MLGRSAPRARAVRCRREWDHWTGGWRSSRAAGRGLGRAHALLFAREGARVVVNDTGGGNDGSVGGSTENPAEEVAAEIRDAGGEAIADSSDVADWDGAEQLWSRRRSTPSAVSTSSSTTPASSATASSST